MFLLKVLEWATTKSEPKDMKLQTLFGLYTLYIKPKADAPTFFFVLFSTDTSRWKIAFVAAAWQGVLTARGQSSSMR